MKDRKEQLGVDQELRAPLSEIYPIVQIFILVVKRVIQVLKRLAKIK